MITVCILIAAIVVPVIVRVVNRAHRPPSQALGRMQLRGIHQSIHAFAADNKGYFAGLTSSGKVDARAIEKGLRDASLSRLAEEDYYAREYLICPAETDPAIDGQDDPGSFAVLEYAWRSGAAKNTGVRGGEDQQADPPQVTKLGRLEWRDAMGADAVVFSDRMIGRPGEPRSLWTDTPNAWHGVVQWNDNHVTFEETTRLGKDRYGPLKGEELAGRIGDLFDAADGDGRMIAD